MTVNFAWFNNQSKACSCKGCGSHDYSQHSFSYWPGRILDLQAICTTWAMAASLVSSREYTAGRSGTLEHQHRSPLMPLSKSECQIISIAQLMHSEFLPKIWFYHQVTGQTHPHYYWSSLARPKSSQTWSGWLQCWIHTCRKWPSTQAILHSA